MYLEEICLKHQAVVKPKAVKWKLKCESIIKALDSH